MLAKLLYLLFGAVIIERVNSVVPVTKTDDKAELIDYYWRDYNGIIPKNAIPGGRDKFGATTYIGQMYYQEFGVLPASIHVIKKMARAAGGNKSFFSNKHVKILCSDNVERYEWIATKNEETHLLADCHLVVGGTEAGYVLNIGRVSHEMEVAIGKVFAHHTPFKGLNLPHSEGDEGGVSYQSYEILTYNCNLFPNCGNINISIH